MAFRDLDEFLVIEPVQLPIRGKVYSFPGSVSAKTGLFLQRAAVLSGTPDVDPDTVLIPDEMEDDLFDELLGDAQQEMIDDRLTSAHIRHVFDTLVVFHMAGREAAEAVWEDTGQGEAKGPSGASSATASRTPTRASSAGTTSPRRSGPAAAAQGGPNSSSSGRSSKRTSKTPGSTSKVS